MANSSICPTEVHGPGWAGFANCAREVLAEVDMEMLVHADQREFEAARVQWTEEVLRRWSAANGGGTVDDAYALARKCVNSFLGQALYNTEIAAALGDNRTRLMSWLEPPLDRPLVEDLLVRLRPGPHWPRGMAVSFPGLRSIDRDAHRRWQRLASLVADEMGLDNPYLLELGLEAYPEFSLDGIEHEGCRRILDEVRAEALTA